MKKKKKKQPDQVAIAYVLAGVLIAGMMTLLGIGSFMTVNSIIVEGISVYTAEQVAEASGVSGGDNLLYINKESVTKRIIDELPYINSVEIDRDLPDTLIIRVTESTALAYIPFAGDAIIIDSTGRVLDIMKITIGTPVTAGGVRLIEIRGVPINEASAGSIPEVGQGSEMSFSAMQDLLSVMEREGIAADINYLDVANIINISFGYLDMYRVTIGALTGFRHKISNLPLTVSEFQGSYPNARGQLNLTDPSGEYRFIPD